MTINIEIHYDPASGRFRLTNRNRVMLTLRLSAVLVVLVWPGQTITGTIFP